MARAHWKYGAVLSTLLLLVAPFPPPEALAPSSAPPTESGTPSDSEMGPQRWASWLSVYDRDGDRLDDRVERLAHVALGSGNPGQPLSILMNFDKRPDLPTIRSRLPGSQPLEDPYVFKHIDAVAARVVASELEYVSSLPGLVAVEWSYPILPMLDVSAPASQAVEARITQSLPHVSNGQTAENLGYQGEGTVIAILDSGVQNTHEVFEGKWISGVSYTDGAGLDCTDGMDDEIGHGTLVASIALGNPPGKYKGTAPRARLVEIAGGQAVQEVGFMDRGLDWVLEYNAAIERGDPLCPGLTEEDMIDVVNLSIGTANTGGPDAGTSEDLIERLAEKGTVVVIAAGNCGPSFEEPRCTAHPQENGVANPAVAAGGIAVAAYNDAGSIGTSDDLITNFSARGPVSAGPDPALGTAGGATDASTLKDRYRKPDVGAPGVAITGAARSSFSDFDYRSEAGTSVAAPHVAGIAALLIQAGKQVRNQTGDVNVMKPTGTGYDTMGNYILGEHPVRDALIHGAHYRFEGANTSMLAKWEGAGAHGLPWNNAWGYGAANAFGALCWAWENVLGPAGARMPNETALKCGTTLSARIPGPYLNMPGAVTEVSGLITGGIPPYAYSWGISDATCTITSSNTNPAFVSCPTVGNKSLTLTVADSTATTRTISTNLHVRRPSNIFIDDAEGNVALNWTIQPDSLILPKWHPTTVHAMSGRSFWHGDESLEGNAGDPHYPASQDTSLISHDISSPGGGPATLSVYAWGKLNGLPAHLDVMHRAGPDGSWHHLARLSGLVATSGPYVEKSFQFRPTTDSLQLGFRLLSRTGDTYYGIFLDDIILEQIENHPPMLAPIPPLTVLEGNTLQFNISAADPDYDTAGFQLENLPAGAYLTDYGNGTARFEWTPSFRQVGTYPIDVIAWDGALSAIGQIDVTVEEASAPVLMAIGPQTGQEDEELHLGFVASDSDSDPLAISINGKPSAALFVDNGNGTAGLTWTPSFTDAGSYALNVTVSDGNQTDFEEFVLTISNVDRPPQLDPVGDRTVSENQLLSFGVGAADPDGDVLTFSVGNLPPGSSFSSSTRTFSWTPTFEQAGTYFSVNITVSDGELSDWETITIQVSNVNRAPVLSPVGQKSAAEGQSLGFSVSAIDADGDSIQYAATNLPTGAVFDTSSGVFSWTPNYSQAGTYSNVNFSATDGSLAAWEFVSIIVQNTNRAPILDPVGAQSGAEGTSLQFTLTATDPDSNGLTFSATDLPIGASLNPSTGVFSWTPGYSQAGIHGVTFRVSDGGLVDEEEASITIANTNRAPVLNTIGSKQVNEGNTLAFTVSGSDPDGEALTYSASNLPPGATFSPATHIFDWTPTNAQIGTYSSVHFEVSDGSLTDSEDISITVTDLPQCQDGTDNDGDGKTDFGDAASSDTGCSDLDDDTEGSNNPNETTNRKWTFENTIANNSLPALWYSFWSPGSEQSIGKPPRAVWRTEQGCVPAYAGSWILAWNRNDACHFDRDEQNYDFIWNNQDFVNLQGKTNATLRFAHRFDIGQDASCECDKLMVQLSHDNGNWETVKQWDSRNSDVTSWTRVNIDIDAYAGDASVWIRLYADSVTGNSNAHAGWYIDDLEVTAS